MLKALELYGFKSFADKTRFDFPEGITVVVGPNGSGKSNIVDAMKWALGEQSVKSLRGKEMADVIFKGSGAGRKPMNAAEVTIIFDNASRRLPLDAPEVHVTRRVYRSGEGEYLINGAACRMRDVKDLFRGTGVGTDAYSLIEQGKVDTLLASSMKDRRALFEEAAGISRFKAKKVESQRRLERVDQNLLRLSDIVEEVEGRLKMVRQQAVKARRYKEHSDRLQQLRTQVAQADWRKLSERLDSVTAELAEVSREAAEAAESLGQGEAQARELDERAAGVETALHAAEAELAKTRERLTANDSSAEFERRRCVERDEEMARLRSHLTAMSSKAGDLVSQLAHLAAASAAEEEAYESLSGRVGEHEASAARIAAELARQRSEHQAQRETHVTQMRTAATLANRIASCQTALVNARDVVARGEERQRELLAELESHTMSLDHLAADEIRLTAEAAQRREEWTQAEEDLAEARRRFALRMEELTQLERRHAAASERALVLEELEQRREGLGAGVKEMLDRAEQTRRGLGSPSGPPAEHVVGLVADLVQTTYEFAPAVDIALGPAAEWLVIDDPTFFEWLGKHSHPFIGRVAFLPLTPDVHSALRTPHSALDNEPGVITRADRAVHCADAHRPLVEQLLANTWFVESLADAVRFHAQHPALNFVTRAGQHLDAAGAWHIGPPQSGAGLVSRRSELRALKLQTAEMETAIHEARADVGRLETLIDQRELALKHCAEQHQAAATHLSEQRARLEAAREQQALLRRQQQIVAAELSAAESQQAAATVALAESHRLHAEAERVIASLEANLRAAEQHLEELSADQRFHAGEATALQVARAKSEQRLEGLRTQRARFERDQEERTRTIDEARGQLGDCTARRGASELAILAATADSAQLYLARESLATQLAALAEQKSTFARDRTELVAAAGKLRSRVKKLEEKQHQLELSAGEARHERNTLVERLRDDYGIELAQLEAPPADEAAAQERTQVDEEIAELRRKINNIGAVNMDALAELEDLETRFGGLSQQYQDLVSAKQSLEKIIQRINADSRRLFAETLEAIRKNFQAMFRRVFGGGSADIVLEEGADILEAGIEIVATPVGKQSLGLSLLSGGERALTAVTLLLAIFQFRPSPFCVLDEVDGPLDEANIGRFVDVLKSFLSTTKFVVVTHSKKTMTAAHTLYGVTMQESGVSKRVSVRFDDVSDDGRIKQEALDRAGDDQPAEHRDVA